MVTVVPTAKLSANSESDVVFSTVATNAKAELSAIKALRDNEATRTWFRDNTVPYPLTQITEAMGWVLERPKTPRPRARPQREFLEKVAETLTAAKAGLMSVRDRAADRAISQGVVFDGVTYSASPKAQAKWAALYHVRDVLKYPIYVTSKNNDKSTEVKDAETLASMYDALMRHVADCLVSCMTLKHEIMNLKSHDDIETYRKGKK